MYTDLAQLFDFPDYFGRNLDALNDCLTDVAIYEYGASRDSGGTVTVLNHFNAFVNSHRDVAQVLLEIFADAGQRAMLVGHRMLWLVQSDDPQIEFKPVGASAVMWNPRETLKTKRTP
jgi:hypothetical protein